MKYNRSVVRFTIAYLISKTLFLIDISCPPPISDSLIDRYKNFKHYPVILPITDTKL